MPQLAVSPESLGGLLVMTYDATGLATVHVDGWPLLGWNMDATNPINPQPVTIGNPLAGTPPNTGAIKSPEWAYVVSEDAVYVPDTWRGTLAEFFTWLATNNGANRKVSTWFTFPRVANAWNIWARENPDLVG